MEMENESENIVELEERVRLLEKALADEKLRVMALQTMIDIAERELKIHIRESRSNGDQEAADESRFRQAGSAPSTAEIAR